MGIGVRKKEIMMSLLVEFATVIGQRYNLANDNNIRLEGSMFAYMHFTLFDRYCH